MSFHKFADRLRGTDSQPSSEKAASPGLSPMGPGVAVKEPPGQLNDPTLAQPPASPSRFSGPAFAVPAPGAGMDVAAKPVERPVDTSHSIEQPPVEQLDQHRPARVTGPLRLTLTGPLPAGVDIPDPVVGEQIPPQLVSALYERVVAGIRTDVQLERTPEIEHMLAGRIMQAMQEVKGSMPGEISPGEVRALVEAVMDEILGYGPLESLLKDDSVTEIMVNGPEQVWVERKGHVFETGLKFVDDGHVMRIAQRIVAPLGRRLDPKWPMVDARLPDGSRVNIIIPPCALQGSTITIRKFFKTPLTVANLVEFGTLSQQMADFLQACVVGRLNVVISGGTGSGKTTLLNVLSSFIPGHERIVTIEDSAELKLNQRHVVSLEGRPPDADSGGAVTIRNLVVNSLRMRPDRIVVGEVRSGEALDMLQAMNTGHDGSLTTLHANTPRDALSRLETMSMMSGMDLPLRVIREQIASAVDLIVQQARLRDGSRKVIYITELQGMEGDTIVLQDIFRFRETGTSPTGQVLGSLQPTGLVPKFLSRLEASGQHIDRSMFMPR
jgi:pilus assembly protein CpaF